MFTNLELITNFVKFYENENPSADIDSAILLENFESEIADYGYYPSNKKMVIDYIYYSLLQYWNLRDSCKVFRDVENFVNHFFEMKGSAKS